MCTAVVGAVGIAAGVIGGLSGGILDTVLNQVTTTILVLLHILLAALIIYALEGHLYQVAAIGAATAVLWPVTSQAVRAEVVLKSRHNAQGITNMLFPAVGVTLVYMTIAAAASLIVANTLDFLGMGDPLVMSWGQMLSLAMMGRGTLAGWWTIVFPGVTLTYMVVSFFFLSYAVKGLHRG